jgi:hypothetical protein
VVEVLGAPERRRLGTRRQAATDPGGAPAPAPVTTGRATVVDATGPLAGDAAARAWLRSAGEAEAAEALAVLGRVLHAHRIAAADPWAREAPLADAVAVRVGYATGEQAAEGRLAAGRPIELSASKRGRSRRRLLRPHEHMAAILAGRVEPLVCEELALRARADLSAGRMREAALSVGLALEAALTELAAETSQGRVAELGELREGVGRAAGAALGAVPSPAELEAVEHALERLEAALRARAAELGERPGGGMIGR